MSLALLLEFPPRSRCHDASEDETDGRSNDCALNQPNPGSCESDSCRKTRRRQNPESDPYVARLVDGQTPHARLEDAGVEHHQSEQDEEDPHEEHALEGIAVQGTFPGTGPADRRLV